MHDLQDPHFDAHDPICSIIPTHDLNDPYLAPHYHTVPYVLFLFSMIHTFLLMIPQNYSNAWSTKSSPAPDDPLVLLLLMAPMILALLLMIL